MFREGGFALVSAILVLQLGARARAQQGPSHAMEKPATASSYNAIPTLQLSVFSGPNTPLDRQALIRLHNKESQAVLWQTTQGEAQAVIGDLPAGDYDIEVSAAGFVTAHHEVVVASSSSTFRLDVTLQPDPSATDSGKPIEQMPFRARKETQRGLAALKSGNLRQAQKQLDAAYEQANANAYVQFLLGYLSFKRGELGEAKTHLTLATATDPDNYQALLLLGRIGLQQQDFAAAKTALEQAVRVDTDSWMGHELLGRAYLMQREFEKARQQAELAIENGKGVVGSAQLILGEALADLGRSQEALSALKTFLSEVLGSPVASEVRELIARLQGYTGEMAGNIEVASPNAAPQPFLEPLVNSDELTLSMFWEPRGVDEVKPAVAAGITCPYEELVERSGRRMKELVDNLARFTAIETLHHEDLDELGQARSKQERKFNYLVEIAESQAGYPLVDEHRSGYSGLDEFPENIATLGMPILALIFHPTYRTDYQMRCEGLGQLHGQPTWLVHFRQRDDRPSRMHAYKIKENFYPVSLKGRAWIAADDFQILRIESDLVTPMPTIQLLREHQVVEYGPVRFPKKKTELWLPKRAELYFNFLQHRYLRRHSFDHFMLFSVDTQEKYKEREPG